MDKIYREIKKAQVASDIEVEPMSDLLSPPSNVQQVIFKRERQLTIEEKKYLLATERGDIATVKYYLDEANSFEEFSINAVDPLGRSALHIAIEYENIEMIEVLLNYHVDVGEALLHAINEEFVEAVEMLLNYQDSGISLNDQQNLDQSSNKERNPLFLAAKKCIKNEEENYLNSGKGKKSKWSFLIKALILLRSEKMKTQDSTSKLTFKSFTPDITPLILAAHKDNYEIIKILLDRGEQIPEPHDVRCSCNICITSRSQDSLKYSKSRINAYRALASPSLISLSSKDPILTAFQLSWELKRLSKIENELKVDYEKLSQQCQEYASALLAETRTSHELEIILNYDHENPPALFENENEKNSLSRLKLAIKYKQKKFVAHPHCQQLLVRLWYDGISGYRRRNIVVKTIVIIFIALLFPFLSLLYILLPRSKIGGILRQPFTKFICHSASYIMFLGLLIMVSLRINTFVSGINENEEENKEKRGPPPTNVEWLILCYVASFIWSEIKQLYNEGVFDYLHDWWNLLDFITNSLYITTIVLKVISFSIVQNEMKTGKETYKLNREKWDPWDPTLISEGIFACANIFSALKMVYIFTINPHLGPLIISLGRMIFDIMKVITIMLLVAFSFSCGFNQLYWYYAQMRNKECHTKIFEHQEEREECFLNVKYFSNLFETLQTLYWGFIGLIEKDRLETLYRKHTFTMFIGLLMFGVYCIIMSIVLVNMFIAMMSNSYQIIANQADEEWKFARSKLWVSYFEEGSTLPAPFNIIPTPKSLYYLCRWFYRKLCCIKKNVRKQQKWLSVRKIVKKISEREYRYQSVVKELVKRYIMRKQQRNLNAPVTEDDLNEIKQDISALRFELLEIFKKNDYKIDVKQNPAKRKRGKLNLEKAMSKNMFDEANPKKIDLFSSLKSSFQQKNLIASDFDNLKKESKRSNASTLTFKDSPEIIGSKEDKFKSKFKSSFTSNKSSNTSSPTMYKIAMRLKKFTESKRLISTQSDSSFLDHNNNNNLVNENKNDFLDDNELSSDRKKNFNRSCEFDLDDSPSLDFNLNNPPKASIETENELQMNEKITEV